MAAATIEAGRVVFDALVEQVRRHGADPFAFFEWAFEKLMHNSRPERLATLLPVEWF